MLLMERLKQIPALVQAAPDLWERNKTKLARHTTRAGGYPDLAAYINASDENLEDWQRIQRKPVFHPCIYVVGLREDGDCNARLVGVYQKLGENPEPQSTGSLVANKRITETLARALPYSGEKRYYYNLRRIWSAADLPKPIIIRWRNSSKGRIIFHQWAHKRHKVPKEVISG